jgi:hypothetical protein
VRAWPGSGDAGAHGGSTRQSASAVDLVAGSNQKSLELMVGATGFEPATPASQTQIAVEKINKNNDLCPRLTIFISLYSRGFGDQSVVGKFEAPFAISD